MDPNANLKEQAETLAVILRIDTGLAPTVGRVDLSERNALRRYLTTLRADLTDWLHAGGCAPDWSKYPTAARYYPQSADPLANLNAAARHTLSTGRIEDEPMPGDN